MIDNRQWYIIEYKGLVFSFYIMIYIISNQNFGPISKKDLKSYRCQRLSFSQELQNNLDIFVIFIIFTLIEYVDDKNIRLIYFTLQIRYQTENKLMPLLREREVCNITPLCNGLIDILSKRQHIESELYSKTYKELAGITYISATLCKEEAGSKTLLLIESAGNSAGDC